MGALSGLHDKVLRWYFSDGLYEEEYEDYELDKEDDSSDEDESLDEDESSDKDNEWDENCRSCHYNNDFCLSRVTSPGGHPGQDEDDESDDDNHDRVCLCDPTDIREGTSLVENPTRIL